MSTISSRPASVKPSFRRRVYPPATLSSCVCTVRPVAPCDLMPSGSPGQVHVNGQAYAISYNAHLPTEGDVILLGYRLMKGDGVTYDVGPNGCDCADCTFRARKCKHFLAAEWLVSQGQLASISE